MGADPDRGQTMDESAGCDPVRFNPQKALGAAGRGAERTMTWLCDLPKDFICSNCRMEPGPGTIILCKDVESGPFYCPYCGTELDITIKGRKKKMKEETRTQTHEFYIAGVKFHQLRSIISKLKEGDKFSLVPEPTNKFDPNAVRIEHLDYEEDTMCGYVPKRFSSEVSAMITVGKHIECTITELNPKAEPWEMCKVVIEEVE